MANLRRVFNVVEIENGWIINDQTHADGGKKAPEIWIAKDLGDLGKVLTALCSPEGEEKEEGKGGGGRGEQLDKGGRASAEGAGERCQEEGG